MRGSLMTIMNITACRMFEDEIVELIEKDGSRIENIYVVNNDESIGIAEKINGLGFQFTYVDDNVLREGYWKSSDDNFSLMINILSLSLHGKPRELKQHVYSQVKKMAQFSDGILMFYGLCGNVLKQIETDWEKLQCPVSILKDSNNKIVDDCIGAVVGGRKSFLKMISSFERKNSLLMTPMWIENWQSMFKYCGFIENEDDIDSAKFVIDSMGYDTVVMIKNDASHVDSYESKIQEFAELFDLQVLEVEGNRKLIYSSYMKFKQDIINSNSKSYIISPNLPYQNKKQVQVPRA